MKRIWWEQIKAVMRLEIKKTFFATRGLWIYFVALVPVVIFIAYSIVNSTQIHRSTNLARRQEKRLTYQDLQAVQNGMTMEQVIALLGKPPVSFHWTEHQGAGADRRTIVHDEFHYSDG